MAKRKTGFSQIEQDSTALCFKALSDPNRIKILNRICCCSSKLKVGEVAECCNVDLSVVSRHLNQLRQSGIIQAQKVGREVYYSLNGKSLVRLLRNLADYIEQCQCC